jgi:peptide/nickel transport system substrate-binding protein
MANRRQHPYIKKLVEQFTNGRVDRREFLRTSTLLGLSAATAYAIAGNVSGGAFLSEARAEDLPKGGTIRVGHRVPDLSNPHALGWFMFSNITFPVVQTLTRTGADNVTRPLLCASWEPSEDLRSWTINLRKEARWRKGRPFTADDVIWNIKHVLDPATGSSSLGLMKPYLLNEAEDTLWDANALEKVDDHTMRLNLRVPQVAIPEHLFHYTNTMLDPEEGGVFQAGSNGTGPFELTELEVQRKAVLKAVPDYWGGQPYLDGFEFIDLGDDTAAALGALASGQVDGLFRIEQFQIDAVKSMENIQLYSGVTALTATFATKVTQEPWSNPKILMAMKKAVDNKNVLAAAAQGNGLPAQHHHACPIHPEYAEIPGIDYDPEGAKQLLVEAGFPDGIDAEVQCIAEPQWEVAETQAIVDQLAKVGIRFKINVLPGSQFWEVWDKAPVSHSSWAHRPLAIQLYALVYRTGAKWNLFEWSNQEFDDLLVQAEGLADVEKRREVTAKLETILRDEGPMLQCIWVNEQTAYDKRVKGFQLHPSMCIFPETMAIEA